MPPDQSPIHLCRYTCARVLGCLDQHCNRTIPGPDKAGAFVDCNQVCNTDTAPVLGVTNETCSELAAEDYTRFFGETICNEISSNGDLFDHEGTPPPPSPPPAPPASQTIPPSGMPDMNARRKIWVALGSTDEQRLYNIQVAVNRHLNTAIKDPCLVDKANFTSVYRGIFTSFLCTLFGGPRNLTGCAYGSSPVYSNMEALWARVYRRHHAGGRNISHQHMHKFVNMLVSAVSSVVTLSDTDISAIENLFHTFDDAVIEPSSPGCHAGEGPVLMWRPGEQHNTTIQAGGRITWVWADDTPNAIIGTSATPKNFFQGFGSGRMVLSRQTVCTEGMVGKTDHYAEPVPCKLQIYQEDTVPTFTYTKIFQTPGEYRYAGGPFGAQSLGQVMVLPTETTPSLAEQLDPLLMECAAGCPYSNLANGQCNVQCNVPSCTFDGGDCSCVQAGVDFPLCTCPSGQSRDSDGACCESSAVGTALSFPFSLRTFGPDLATSLSVLSLSDYPISRKVSDKNRMLVGMLIMQERTRSVHCTRGVFTSLTSCTGPQEARSFGINPHYLTSSSLYDASAAQTMVQDFNASEFDQGGLPYGFIWKDAYANVSEGYPIVFDINLNNQAATSRLQYLVDGSFLDNGTESIKVFLMTYNADYQMFGLTEVAVRVNEGGIYYAASTVHAIPAAYYTWSSDDVARFVLEVIFLCCVAWNILEEVLEVLRLKFETGSTLSYFRDGWNWLDMISISIQLTGIGLWLYLVSLSQATAAIQPRYDVYTTLLETPEYWETPDPPTGLAQASQAFDTLDQWVFTHHIYFTLQGINVFLVTLRLLKLLDFQPYLGIITRSIAIATPNLVHFFIVWIIVMLSFSLFAFMVFGDGIEAFSNLKRAFLTCFLIMLNDNSVTYNFIYMEGWEFVAGLVWWFAFTCVIIFVLLNFLIAIVVEAFMEVKESGSTSTTIAQDIGTMIRRAGGRWFGPYWRYDRLLKHLYSLGAADFRKAEASSMRRNSFARALNNFNLFHVFDKKEMFAQPETKKLVLKVNGDQCLDPNSLDNIVHRSYNRNVEETGEARSASFGSRTLSSLARMTFRREHPQEEQLEKLSSTLMRMFGEEVEAHKLKPVQHQHAQAAARKGQELAEIRRLLDTMQTDTDEALEAIHDETAASLEALQQSVLALSRQIQRLTEHSGVPVDAEPETEQAEGSLHSESRGGTPPGSELGGSSMGEGSRKDEWNMGGVSRRGESDSLLPGEPGPVKKLE